MPMLVAIKDPQKALRSAPAEEGFAAAISAVTCTAASHPESSDGMTLARKNGRNWDEPSSVRKANEMQDRVGKEATLLPVPQPIANVDKVGLAALNFAGPATPQMWRGADHFSKEPQPIEGQYGPAPISLSRDHQSARVVLPVGRGCSMFGESLEATSGGDVSSVAPRQNITEPDRANKTETELQAQSTIRAGRTTEIKARLDAAISFDPTYPQAPSSCNPVEAALVAPPADEGMQRTDNSAVEKEVGHVLAVLQQTFEGAVPGRLIRDAGDTGSEKVADTDLQAVIARSPRAIENIVDLVMQNTTASATALPTATDLVLAAPSDALTTTGMPHESIAGSASAARAGRPVSSTDDGRKHKGAAVGVRKDSPVVHGREDKPSQSSANETSTVSNADDESTPGVKGPNAPESASEVRSQLAKQADVVPVPIVPTAQNSHEIAHPHRPIEKEQVSNLVEPSPVTAAVVNSAKLLQSVQGSELRFGMRTPDLGNVAIRTSLGHDQVAVEITVEHSELGNAITKHLSVLESKLASEHGMQAQVVVASSGAGSGDFSGGARRDSSPQTPAASFPGVGSNLKHRNLAVPVPVVQVAQQDRLDVRV